MSRVIRRHWAGNPDAPSRRGRVPCDYDAYGPDLLAGRHFTFEGDVAADVADAETAIVRLNAQASALADTEALDEESLRLPLGDENGSARVARRRRLNLAS
jgi:hypothetical protein